MNELRASHGCFFHAERGTSRTRVGRQDVGRMLQLMNNFSPCNTIKKKALQSACVYPY